MTIDISATRSRPSPFDPDYIFKDRPLGRHAPRGQTVLTDTQERVLARYTALVPPERQAEYRQCVFAQLAGGKPGGGALQAAAIIAALAGFIDRQTLAEHGLSDVATAGRKTDCISYRRGAEDG